MKTLNRIFVFCMLLTAASVLGGEYLHTPWMYNVAGMSFGLLAIIGAIQILITGEARGTAAGVDMYHESKYTERYSGAKALIIGIVGLLAGFIFIALSSLDLFTPGGIDAFWDRFLRSPRAWGLILALAGSIVTLMGIVRAKSGSAATPDAYSKAVEAEFKIEGIFAAIAGSAMLVIAALLIIAPDVLLTVLEHLKTVVKNLARSIR